MLVELFSTWMSDWGVHARWIEPLAEGASALILVFCAWLANWIAKRVILRSVSSIVRRSSNVWDDALMSTGVFTRLSHVAPALVLTFVGEEFFTQREAWSQVLNTTVSIYLVVILLLVLDAVLNAIVRIFNQNPSLRTLPLGGFQQGMKLVLVLIGAVFVLSLLLKRSPLYLLSGLGALTAVLLLIFKDAILGLVAGIQITSNRMVQIGDWIEMPKYGADGDVIDVGLTIVKVRNWDNTITTIPTYALTADPVKNWRGMQESGGRRIKRSIYLDMESFRFLDDALLQKMLTFRRLRPYLEQKLPELEEYNQREGEDLSVPVNGRRLTNIGCYRAYVNAYVRSHPNIHQELTLLVRHLAPTDKGLPLEVYAFTSDTRWAAYEGIQADIFDHLLAIVPEFDLRLFQSPTGRDFRGGDRNASAPQVTRESPQP